jgi:hypothetical protein
MSQIRHWAIGARTDLPLQRDLTFSVIALLPLSYGTAQYRIQSGDEEFAWTASEDELIEAA